MTAPTKNAAPAKSAAANKAAPATKGVDERIPEALANTPIFKEFCDRYLTVLDEINEYNKAVLAERDSEWNPGKVLAKAREFASPEDDSQADEKIKSVYENWERIQVELSKARKELLNVTAEKLGITLSITAERNPEAESALKEKRKLASTIGSQLSDIAKMTSDEKSTTAITEFLGKNALPAVGRNQTTSFSSDGGGSTPKYRVTVSVFKDGEKLLEEKGFTKAALALTKPVFNYERGKSLKSEDLRKAWENAGNTPDNTAKSTVEFEDNDLHFVISKN